MTAGGKGHMQRPRSVSDEEYASRWDAIFQRDLPEHTKMANEALRQAADHSMEIAKKVNEARAKDTQIVRTLPRSLIEGIMSTETCAHPFCDCKDVCSEAK